MTPAVRVAVTGAAGSIGRRVVAALVADGCHVMGLDLATPDLGIDLRPFDVRDAGLATLLADEAITHVVHLAAIVDTDADPDLAYDVDVNGSRNVMEACVAAGVGHLTVTSSGAAYGYHADNPVPLTEDDPLRGNEDFAYSHHKRLVEEALATARIEHPALGQLVLRVGTVLGVDMRSPVTDLLTRPVIPAVTGATAGFVFVWDDDLVEVVRRGVTTSRTGVFNVAGSGAVSTARVARAMGGRAVAVPAGVLRAALTGARRAGVGRYGPAQVDFLAHRPVLDNRRLREEFPYTPTRTSAEALTAFAAVRGRRT